ncbi:hypothetical protein HYC85_004561 [Camellia sinensis]|uniref:Uncharacterized protein n=1 Tax=Camellia sinensis TaxID=4442 RepID=A0A7J7HYV8_CAMSI|nr:hypothetical protein HYC85_004561 [Camellia sinensis]
MATSAFKSTTKRTPISSPSNAAAESSSSTKPHRRSRSLSRFSRLLPDPPEFADPPRGRFVNTARGSAFPEISLDDLTIEFFSLNDSLDERDSQRGRSSRRCSEISPATNATVSSQRRGRSVSRQSSGVGDGKRESNFDKNGCGGRTGLDANSRRRRSVSVVRGRNSDSESQSSALTDDEANDARSSKNMIEKTIRAVYAQKKAEHPTGDDVNNGLFEAMRKELRYAVDEIRMELEHGMVRKTSALASESSLQADDSNVLQAVPKVRKKYTTKLEQSEKRKQDLLAEIALEEQHGRELSKIVRELLPDPKSSANAEKPSRARKRSNDKNRVSKRLTEEAEKYFEDFISNVEDTDLSSYDGERSDASSTLRVTKTRDAVLHSGETETFRTQTRSNYPPVEIMDGVILPWLQWETCNDGSALPSKNKRELPVTPQSISWDADQEAISAQHPSGNSASSRGSWSPGLDGPSSNTGEATGSILKEVASHQRSQFDMDRYLKLGREEDHLFERWKEQNRIDSGVHIRLKSSFSASRSVIKCWDLLQLRFLTEGCLAFRIDDFVPDKVFVNLYILNNLHHRCGHLCTNKLKNKICMWNPSFDMRLFYSIFLEGFLFKKKINVTDVGNVIYHIYISKCN